MAVALSQAFALVCLPRTEKNTRGRGAVPLVEFYDVLRGHHLFEIQVLTLEASSSFTALSDPKVSQKIKSTHGAPCNANKPMLSSNEEGSAYTNTELLTYV